jgi:hypothetical protein
MTPAQHDYLPDVMAARRRAALRETALIDAAVFATLAFISGATCAISTAPILNVLGACTATCVLACLANLIRFHRLGKARP